MQIKSSNWKVKTIKIGCGVNFKVVKCFLTAFVSMKKILKKTEAVRPDHTLIKSV